LVSDRFKLISAVHLFLVQGDQVLLARRRNTGYEDGNYSVIAGHLDGDEEVVAAAIREAAEEAGVVIVSADLATVGVMHRRSTVERVDFFVAAQRWSGTPRNLEPDKCDDLRWFALAALPPNTVPYVRRALDLYQRHGGRMWFDSFGWDA
jgi:8-oxo-dGTP pyrophosphatase MutT (NUDIX family)